MVMQETLTKNPKPSCAMYPGNSPNGPSHSLSSVGMPSTINFRLLVDGSWEANTCIPLPSCNPDALSGTYSIALVPEPGSGALLGLGVAILAWVRRRPEG